MVVLVGGNIRLSEVELVEGKKSVDIKVPEGAKAILTSSLSKLEVQVDGKEYYSLWFLSGQNAYWQPVFLPEGTGTVKLTQDSTASLTYCFLIE